MGIKALLFKEEKDADAFQGDVQAGMTFEGAARIRLRREGGGEGRSGRRVCEGKGYFARDGGEDCRVGGRLGFPGVRTGAGFTRHQGRGNAPVGKYGSPGAGETKSAELSQNTRWRDISATHQQVRDGRQRTLHET